jgi:predicted aspartyl protease
MKMTVQTYLNHVSDDEFEKSILELKESRRRFLEARINEERQPHAAEGAMVVEIGCSSASEDIQPPARTYPQQNLQREIVATTVATAPIVLMNTVFEEGVIDTGATNTMVSQSAVRRLGMMDQVEPSKVKFSSADGKMSAPWGIIRKLPVGVEGFTILIDVFVSGATSYDVLLGTDWLTQAHAEISFAKSEMTYRIDPHFMGRVPITVLPAERIRRSYQYCDFH